MRIINKALFSVLIVITTFTSLSCNNASINTNERIGTNDANFNRRASQIIYTKHALCRMDCRHISRKEIAEILKNGEVNFAKSDLDDKPCPTYALQGNTSSGEHLRVIFAQCEGVTKVVTCYNLEEDFECYCPGDENKKRH